METKPIALTDEDFKELTECQDIRDAFPSETDQELEETLRGLWIAKYPHYITDGPGFAGEVFVILTGVLNTILLIRKAGAFHMIEQEY
jgi:hypothetical protein